MITPAFELDKQTLADLAIFPDHTGNKSILNLFDRTITFGGRDKLREIFENPLTDAGQIEQRIGAIAYFQKNHIDFGADKGACDFIEFYLNRPNKPTSISKITAIEKRIRYFFTGDNNYYVISRGISYMLEALTVLDEITKIEPPGAFPELLKNFSETIRDTLHHPDFIFVRALLQKQKLSAIEIARADHLFRYVGYKRIKVLLNIIYQMDVFATVAAVGKQLAFSFPIINKSGIQVLNFHGLWHPFISNPVPNHIDFSHDKNVCFVTGANMAGKSTLLKAVGVSVFLSQIGFPVPAIYMETSVFDGLITTINLADNIQQGNSHFYAEVSRIKHVAQRMAQSQNKLVIFDELFRGTNVKDAFDASLAIVSAFAKLRKSFFVISTHIVEVANELTSVGNINFKFMESVFDNGVPTYNYLLKDGITEERLGMWIVKNEGIVEIIEGIVGGDN